MTITLITRKEYDLLMDIRDRFPSLTLDNKGYEGIDRREFTEDEKNADRTVNIILRSCVKGFSSFQNFRSPNDKGVRVRLQYNYGADGGMSFTGVGYIYLHELLNGFDEQIRA